MSTRLLKSFLRSTLESCGYSLSRITPAIDRVRDRTWHDLVVALDVITSLQVPDLTHYRAFFDFAALRRQTTFAQNFQDIFVQWTLGEIHSGTFVEFGAADGVKGSNTLLLERTFAWKGLLLEPNRNCHRSLAINRRVPIDHRAVFHTSGQRLSFVESTQQQLSRLASYETDADAVPAAARYEVTTVTLDEVLEEYRIPTGFELLSIDVEGAEPDVLAGFTIDAWRPRVVVIEHNARLSDYNRIERFFLEAGYTKRLPAFSRNDLWFVRESR